MSELQALIQDYGLNGVGDGPIYNIQSANVTRELDGAGRFSFATPLADERAIELATNERRAVVYIYHPNGTSRELTSGIIRQKAEQGDNWSIGGPDLLAELANENTLINRAYNGVAITTVLSELIALVRSNRNLCVGGTASASSALSGPAADAFDQNPATYWSANAPAWIEYEFLEAYDIRRYSVAIFTSNSAVPLAWTLEYYDGATWIAVDTQIHQVGWVALEKRVYDVELTGSASTRWRLNISTALAALIQISEITMSPLTDWTIDSTGVMGDFYGSFNGVSVLKALQEIANATGYHFRVEADRNITFGALGDSADLTIIQAGTITDELEDNNEIAVLDQPLRQLSSEGLVNWILPLGKGTPPLSMGYLSPTSIGSSLASYDESNRNAWYNLRGSGTDYSILSQSFEVTTSGVLYAVRLYLLKNGAPTDDLYMTVHNSSSDIGTTGISGRPFLKSEADVSGTGDWLWFWLDRAADVVSGTRYVIQLRTSRQSADVVNFISWGVDTSPVYASGKALRWVSTGGWNDPTADFIFQVYGVSAGETIYTPREVTGPDGTTLYALTDDASTAEYGKIAQVLTIDVEAQGSELADLQNASLLIWRAANSWLSKRVDPQTYYSASIRKGYSTIYPGQLIRLVYNGDVYDENGDKITWADVDDTFWVIRVSETVSANGDLIAQLDLSTIAQSKEDAASRIVSAVESFTVEGIRRFYGPTIMDEQSGTVFSPPSGKWSVYPKSDGLYIKDDAGTETRLLGTTDLTSMVLKSLFDANTILAANSDDTPAALTVATNTLIGRQVGNIDDLAVGTNTLVGRASGNIDALAVAEQTLVGRLTGGDIAALTAGQVRTLLDLGDFAALCDTDAGQTIPDDTYTVVNYDTETINDDGCVVTGAGWAYTVPANGDGIYEVKASLLFAPTTAWAAGEIARLRISVNGGLSLRYLDSKANEGATNHAVMLHGAKEVPLVAGETIQIEVYQNTGGNLALTSAGGFCEVSIRRVKALP